MKDDLMVLREVNHGWVFKKFITGAWLVCVQSLMGTCIYNPTGVKCVAMVRCDIAVMVSDHLRVLDPYSSENRHIYTLKYYIMDITWNDE